MARPDAGCVHDRQECGGRSDVGSAEEEPQHDLREDEPIYEVSIGNVPVWISNNMPSKLWNEITYPFPNFNGCTDAVW